jgi:hypothetical protein
MIQKLFICCCIAIITAPLFAQPRIDDPMARKGDKVRILIQSDANVRKSSNRKIIGLTSIYVNIIDKTLSEKVSCASIITDLDIQALVTLDREKELLDGFDSGKPTSTRLQEIAEAANCDYIISVSVTECPDGFCLNTSTFSAEKEKVATEQNSGKGKGEDDLLHEMHEYANNLADELLAMQICIYKGTITITETEDFNENQPFENNECVEKGYTRNITGTTKWEIEKRSRHIGNGNMKKDITDKSHSWDYGNCIVCSQVSEDGKTVIGLYTEPTGVTTYDLNVTETTKIEGLERMYSNAEAITFIKFDTLAGTFTVQVMANSKIGAITRKREYKCKTTCPRPCDVQKDEPVTNKIQDTLDETYGPFNGKPTDKELSASKTETFTDKTDFGGGTRTVNILVNLSRK